MIEAIISEADAAPKLLSWPAAARLILIISSALWVGIWWLIL